MHLVLFVLAIPLAQGELVGHASGVVGVHTE
jgi:hypothetical protein